MDDEFKLCWKNFQDNIASGFQNLYDRGDLVDVTLACDGKLLHAHKIVLAICSPYFQEIFITNPCKHPIIILKDVSFNIMLELLEFMYQGVVNVKHTELQAFMKIGQLLQIKGLATNTSSSAASTSSEKSSSHMNNADEGNLACGNDNNGNVGAGVASGDNKHLKAATDGGATGQAAAITGKVSNNNNNNNNNNNSSSSNNNSAPSPPMVGDHVGRSQQHSPPPPPTTATSPTPSAMSYVANVLNQHSLKNTAESNVSPLLNLYQTTANSTGGASTGGLKRHLDAFSNDALSIYSRKQFRRSLPTAASEHNSGGDHTHDSADSNGAGGSGAAGSAAGAGAAAADQVNTDDFFLPTIPHISMVESRYDLNNLKREAEAHHGSSAAVAAAVSLRNTFGPAFNFEYNLYKNSAGGGGGGGGGCGSGSGAGTGLGVGVGSSTGTGAGSTISGQEYPNDLHMPNDYSKNFGNHMDIPQISPGEHWFQGKLEFMLSQRGKPLLVHDGHTFGIQYVRKDKKYWQCNLSRKFNCKARVTTTDTGEIIVTNNEHCHTEIRQHLRKDYQRNKVMMNALINLSTNRLAENLRRVTGNSTLGNLSNLQSMVSSHAHHADAHHMEQSILDLGKAAAAAAAVTAASVDSGMVSPHGNLACASLHDGDGDADADADDDDDEEAPLDCGMRSASHVDGISKASTSTSSNGSAHGSSNPSDKWKGKLNNAPLDASQ